MNSTTASQLNRWLDLGKKVLETLTEQVDEGAQREESSSYGQKDPGPPSTDFEIACEFLDLSAKEPFTRDEFERKLREFRVLFHPDTKPEAERARSTRLSQRVAWSEQVIKRHRGW